MAHWLYFQCERAIIRYKYTISTLELSFLVLNVINDIKNYGSFDYEDGEGIQCATYFFRAFGKILQDRDLDFIHELQKKLPQMFDDSDLTKQKLRDVSPGY